MHNIITLNVKTSALIDGGCFALKSISLLPGQSSEPKQLYLFCSEASQERGRAFSLLLKTLFQASVRNLLLGQMFMYRMVAEDSFDANYNKRAPCISQLDCSILAI